MTRGNRWAAALAIALAAGQWASAQAQYGYYPRGYGGAGWGGWGGAQTPQSSMARGMGVYAAGAGMYNEQTAQARSINADTTMRFNEYMYQSSQVAAKKHQQMLAKDKSLTNEAYNQINDRIRNHPDRHDIEAGDALNSAVEEIDDPRVYTRTLTRGRVKIGGDMIRNIPFRYAPGCITVSIHQLTQDPPPPALMTSNFDDDRAAFKSLGQEIRKSLDEGDKPNPATVRKALKVINAAEAKADMILPRNTKDRNDVDKYLKALHGLIGMLDTPSLEILLAGVEKHPEATLADLLAFMSSFNLRFGEAKTQPQRAVYGALYPMLVDLRTEVEAALAGVPAPKPQSGAVGEFFSGMDYQDLQKKAPAPPQPGGRR
ncbi:MAG: hypothetical protein ACHRXM_05875 [Isosphaerales bacterium]